LDEREFYLEARDDLAGPLAGLRVLDVTTAWAGPMAACVLADLGADVIRIEMPGNRDGDVPPRLPGTNRAWMRETLNRNKRSLALDLRKPEDRCTFLRLVRGSDVVIENFRPGVMAGWGVGYEACRSIRPDIVFVSISGWGQFGPLSERPGYDPLAQAMSGWMWLNGDREGEPRKAPTFLADDLAAIHGVIGALAALRHRDRTGEGQHVDAALLDAMLFQSNGFLGLAAHGLPPRHTGNEVARIVPSNVYRCADGMIYLTVALDRHWRALAEAIGRPELARAPGFGRNDERCSNRGEVNELISAWCAKHRVEEAIAALSARGVAVAPVLTFEDAARHPHVRAREMLQEVALPDGTASYATGPAVKFSRTPTRVRSAAPSPGEHTDQILRELEGANSGASSDSER
jgi:formyl-CoA transferase